MKKGRKGEGREPLPVPDPGPPQKLTFSPTPQSPSYSCATRVAMDCAAMTLGWVHTVRPCRKASAQYCGSCVVLPDPVSA